MKAYVIRKKGSKEPPVTVTQSELIQAAIETCRPGELLEVLCTELNAPNPQLVLMPNQPKPKKGE